MTDEHRAGAEYVSAWATHGWSGDPLPAAIPNQIADRGHESRLAPVLVHGVLRKGVASMNLEKIMAGAAISGALGFTALGLGAGVANAGPASPVVAGIPWQQDRGHGGDGGNWGHGEGPDWGDRGGWGYGGNWGYGRAWGCVSGPFGYVTWCP